MAATHLSDHLCVPTTKPIHFDTALCKPGYFFLAVLILSHNWYEPQNFVPMALLSRSQMCPDKTYLCSGTYPDQQHKILFLPSQIITSNGQGFIFIALLKLLAVTQMNRCSLMFFPIVLRDLFLHYDGFFSFVVLHLLLHNTAIGVSVLSLLLVDYL